MIESLGQLEALWQQAGGSTTSAPDAAAIAKAESGGQSVNPNYTDPNGGSFGLWQVNKIHQSILQDLPNWQTDPAQNAIAAVRVWQEDGQKFFTASAHGATGPWAAEGIPGSAAAARYASAKADEAAGNLGTPGTYNQNGVQQWITHALTGGTGTATAPVAGQAGGAAGTQVAATSTGTLGTLQASWAAFWSSHPAWIILAGIVLLGIAWSLVGAPNVGEAMPSAEVKA
jgi:hypothetical protein